MRLAVSGDDGARWVEDVEYWERNGESVYVEFSDGSDGTLDAPVYGGEI